MSQRNINLQQLHACHYFCSTKVAIDWLAKEKNTQVITEFVNGS